MKVFISYHRELAQWPAVMIQRYLLERGADVFLDLESVSSGRFESVILNEIRRREHFVVVLAPGSADRLGRDGDWVAREIAHALEAGSNVIPVLVDGVTMSDLPSGSPEWRKFRGQNALTLPAGYVDSALTRLYDTFLVNPTIEEREAFLAEEHWERATAALEQADVATAIAEIDRALALAPRPEYFLLLAGARQQAGELDAALGDVESAIALDPFGWELMNARFELLQQLDRMQEAIHYASDSGWRQQARLRANEFGERILTELDAGTELGECVDAIRAVAAMHRDQPDGRRQIAVLQDIVNHADERIAEPLRERIRASDLLARIRDT